MTKFDRVKVVFVVVAVALVAVARGAPTPGGNSATRSAKTVTAFKKAYPPPAFCTTGGKYDGKKCEIDHAFPLCAGGPDEVWNLQYQRRSDAAKKDKLEKSLCARLTRCEAP
jgi:hypothetical protein